MNVFLIYTSVTTITSNFVLRFRFSQLFHRELIHSTKIPEDRSEIDSLEIRNTYQDIDIKFYLYYNAQNILRRDAEFPEEEVREKIIKIIVFSKRNIVI